MNGSYRNRKFESGVINSVSGYPTRIVIRHHLIYTNLSTLTSVSNGLKSEEKKINILQQDLEVNCDANRRLYMNQQIYKSLFHNFSYFSQQFFLNKILSKSDSTLSHKSLTLHLHLSPVCSFL